jgi:hypothetical protein
MFRCHFVDDVTQDLKIRELGSRKKLFLFLLIIYTHLLASY